MLYICNKCFCMFQQVDQLSPFEQQETMDTNRKNRQSFKSFSIVKPKKIYPKHFVHTFYKKINNQKVYGHQAIVYDARNMFSVLEPLKPGGCRDKVKATVLETAKQRKCVVAINGGFAHPETLGCYGNVVSNGHLVQKTNSFLVKAVNFGVKQDGSIAVGYIPQRLLSFKNPFIQLVSGIGWILRNGENYVNESLKLQQCSSESLSQFANTKSARSFVGFDEEGRVHIIQVDGRTGDWGINLHDAASLLQSFGITNAINLDGGGASTFITNGSVVNYPSNICFKDGTESLCPANVTTVLCIHESDKCSNNCSNNGVCGKGRCRCQAGWFGRECDKNVLEFSSSWKNYKFIIGLTVTIGVLLVLNIFTCNLAFLYYSRYKILINSSKEKDRLRHYLRSQRALSSTENESDY